MSAQDLDDEDETTGSDGTGDDAGEDAAPAAADDKDASADDANKASAGDGPADDDEDLGAATAKDAPAPAAPVDPEAAKEQAIRDAVMKQYGALSGDAGIQAAKDRAARTNTVANIGEALESLAKSNSMAHGGAGVDQGFYQGIKAQGQQGVQQAQQQREQAIKDFVTKQQLGRDAVQDSQNTAKFTSSQKLTQQEIDAGDPTSQSSQVARASYKAQFPKEAAAMGDAFNNLSFKNLGAISQMTETKAKIDASAAMAESNRQMAASRFQAGQDKQNIERDTVFAKQFGALRDKYNKDTADLDKQDQLITAAASDKNGIAGALVKGGALHDALGRVSQGEFGMAQNPDLMNKAQGLWQKITDGKTLTDRDIQEFKQINAASHSAAETSFLKSAQEMTDTNDRAARHEKGYSAALVGLKAPAEKQTAAGGGAPQPAPVHPQANQALEWAKANPKDPRAVEILKRVGAMNAGL